MDAGQIGESKPYDKSCKICAYLVRNHRLEEAVKYFNLPYQQVRRLALFYERKGIIERTQKYPLLFRWKSKPYDKSKPVEDLSTNPNKPLFIPHKFGATCSLIGRPNISYDKWGKARIKVDSDHTIEFGRGRAQLWLKGNYQGTSPEEIISNARNRILVLADHYAKLYNVNIAVMRFYEDIEWVLNDKPASKDTADKLGIKKKERLEIGGVDYVNTDSTHPEYLELNRNGQYPKHLATEHAKVLFTLGANRPAVEYLVYHAPNDIKEAVGLAKSYGENVKLHLEVMGKMDANQERIAKVQEETLAALKDIRDSLKKDKVV